MGKRGRKKPKQVAEQTVQTPRIANDLEIVGKSEEEEEEDRREATVQLTSFGLGSTALKHRQTVLYTQAQCACCAQRRLLV